MAHNTRSALIRSFDCKAAQYQSFTLTFLLISAVAMSFGYWFASHQVNAVSAAGYLTYPALHFNITITKSYLTIIAFFCLNSLIISRLSRNKISSLMLASTYLPLLFIYTSFPLYWIVAVICLLQLFYILTLFHKEDYLCFVSNYSLDIFALILLFLFSYYLNTGLSPTHWDSAILTGTEFYPEMSTPAPVFVGYLLAKQFSFSFIDHSQWAGLIHTPFIMNSPFVQILAFVFDLPSVSYESFYKTMMSLYFILGIVGCFGYYLFLKYAAGITWIFSLFGGFLFFFGTGPFISTILSGDGGIFLSSFAITPYVMLFISLAFGKSDCYLYSAWAGLALASQFFFFGPHPEGTIYSFLFNSIYATGFIIFSKQHDLRTKIIISLTFIVSFCMLSAFMLVPIFVDVLTHNIYVFTHLNDIRRINLSLFTPYIIILVCSLPISYRLLKKRMDAVYSSSRFLAICLLVFLLLAARPHVFLLPLIKLTHVGLHFNYYWRYGAYFTLSVYTIFIYMLDESTKRIVNKFYG